MSRPIRLAGYILIGVVVGVLVATAAIWLLTRTDWGTERARRFAVSWLDDRISGELRVGRISRWRVLGGVTIHDFAIIDPKGRPFLAADSADLAYNLRTLLGGEVILSRVVLHSPTAIIERLPGDTAWNYEYVFSDTTRADVTGDRRLILLQNTRIINGTAIVRAPIDLDAVTTASDTARVLLDAAPGGGTMRAMRFEAINARLDRAIIESPLEKGRLFEIRSAEARGFVWRDPFIIRDARGTITMRDSIVTFDMPEVNLPGSRAAILGRVIIAEGRNDMDIRVQGQRLQFRDLQWLYPALPDEGGGSMVLRIQSQPGGTLFLAEDARLSAPGTQVAGTFGVVTGGDSIYFTRVDLRASPLDVQFLEQLLPGGLPVDGLLVGTVEVRGPLSALETTGDMRFAGTGPYADSEVSWRGVFDVRGGQVTARSITADVKRLELALITAFNPAFTVAGSVAGRVEGSGRADRLRFTAALEHVSGDGARSSYDGSGSAEGQGRRRRFDVTVNASPATLQDLSRTVPALRGMQGELSGPVHVRGTADDLTFAARLATAGGPLTIEGRAVRSAAGQRVTAEAEAHAFALHALRPELPRTMVSGLLRVDVTGADLATFDGPVELLLDSLRVADMPTARLALYGRLADGVLAVDSSVVRSVAGVGRASGSLGIVEGSHGELGVGFVSENLAALDPWLFGGADVAADAEPRIRGRVDAAGTVSGWLGSLGVAAQARGTGVAVGAAEAADVTVDLAGSGLRGVDARLRLTASADSFAMWSHPVQSARIEAVSHADSVTVTAHAADGQQDKLTAGAAVHRNGGGTATIRLDELRVGGRSPWRLATASSITIADRAAVIDRLEMRHAAGGNATAAGRLGWANGAVTAAPSLDFGVTLTGVPFAEVLRAVRSREEGAGTVEAQLRVHGSALDPLIEAELAARDVLYGDVRIDRAFAELSYAALGLDAHVEMQHDGRSILTGGGRVPVDLRLAAVAERRLAQPLRFSISADSLPPALPLGLLNGFSRVAGRIDGTVTLAGTTLDPAMSGGFTIRGGSADWDVSGVRYRDMNGTFSLEGDRILRVDLRAFAADPRARGVRSLTGATPGGSGRVTGSLDFADLVDPRFDLRFTADRAYAARRRDVEASVTGEVLLGGSYRRPVISGALRVDEGALYIDELYRQYLIVGLELDDPRLLSLVDTSLVAVRPLLAASTNPFLKGMQVRNLQVAVGSDSWLRSRDMDVEVSGNLTVAFDRREEDLRLSGSLNVERGTYVLYYPPLQSRRFQVRQGSIDFVGTPGIDPNLTITAAYRARQQNEPLDVLAIVSGTLQSPRVRLASEAQPPISESDLASYLFFGVPTSEVTGSATGMVDVRTAAGLAIGPSVLGYASSGLQTLVQSVGLLDYVSLTAAEVTPGQTGSGLARQLAGTQLELGRYLGSDVFVGYTQRLGTTGFYPAARLEWRFLQGHSFELFAEDRLARTPGFGLRPESDLRKVYGFSLFREWGF